MNALAMQPLPPRGHAHVRLPGSKSLTNRALVLAALSPGRLRLEGALFSRDSQLMAEALRKLGFEVEADALSRSFVVEGRGGEIPRAEGALEVGNAGTAARFLTALLALHPHGRYELDGDPAMRERPMQGLTDALAAQGVHFTFHERAGHFPFRMETGSLRGGEILLDAGASSQLLSALLLTLPFAREETTLRLRGGTVSRPFVTMTQRLVNEHFSADGELIRSAGDEFFIRQGSYDGAGGRYAIEGDATAASYFLALPVAAPGWEVTIEGFQRTGSLQGDAAFAGLLAEMGLIAQGDTVSAGSCRRGGTWDFNAISDTFLTLAALAPLLESPVRITGIAHTRKQETDRVAAMAQELTKVLGAENVSEELDALEIRPDRRRLELAAREGVEIETYEDHRIAMSFGILGCADVRGDGRPWLTVCDPGCVSKTYPEFFDVLRSFH